MTDMTAIAWPNGRLYVFRGSEYRAYDRTRRLPLPGYPRRITDGWPGLFAEDIDAALPWADGKAYFFRGAEYIRYDIASDRADDGYPRAIADAWPGLFETDIDAAVLWPNGKAYFFRGDEYVRYDVGSDRADDGYPRRITEGWDELSSDGVDMILMWSDDEASFVLGDAYAAFDVASDRVLPGYPKPLESAWPTLAGDWGDPSAGTTDASSPGEARELQGVESPGGGRIRDKSEPSHEDLVVVDGHAGARVRLHRLAADAWERLLSAARADGIEQPDLLPVSGFRTVASQVPLWEAAVEKYGSEAEARRFVAPPGSSAHHTGRAIDCWLGSGPESENIEQQRQTVAWKWLREHAARFGFYPYETEPWHWEYNPPTS